MPRLGRPIRRPAEPDAMVPTILRHASAWAALASMATAACLGGASLQQALGDIPNGAAIAQPTTPSTSAPNDTASTTPPPMANAPDAVPPPAANPPAAAPSQVAGSFRLLPIYDAMTGGSLTADQLQVEMTRLRAQIGENRTHFKVGFSHIYGGPQSLTRNLTVAQKNNLSLGVIIAIQTHSLAATFSNVAATDLRNYQWRLNGTSWAGQVLGSGGSQQFPARDWKVVTPSRYATAMHTAFMTQVRNQATEIAGMMATFPNIIVAVNGAIEEELATAGESDDNYLGDYSPFAIAEFRDWLRHTGGYDGQKGPWAGQGAPASLVGQQPIAGAMRSPFYDDPTPADSNGTGISFNATFGTQFASWKLKYWDLDDHPDAITDTNFSPAPQAGDGLTDGGFDAPRARDPNNVFWNAWSYDVGDHGGVQPPGAPDQPAFGFRQVLVKHFLADFFATVVASGIPQDIVYAHQIPGEMVGAGRGRSGADPVWTGRIDASGTLGNTRFGPYDTKLADSYSKNWGIFEWHPAPGADPQSADLYAATTKALDGFFAGNGYCFFPGWWHEALDTGTFPLNDSKFADAMHDWLAGKPDVPRGS